MKRRRNLGYEPGKNVTIAQSSNTQNARPLLDIIMTNRSKQEPLWWHSDFNSDNYALVNQGELAFTLSDGSLDVKTNSSYSALSTFSDSLDSINYLSTVNGLGNKSESTLYSSHSDPIAMAQKSYREKIRFLGLVIHNVQAAPNLINLGNTLMVGKGKMSIPNTGLDTIREGDYVCWDTPVTTSYESYGMRNLGYEDKRLPLLTVPLQSTDSAHGISTIEEIRDSLINSDYARNEDHAKSVLDFWQGIHAVSASMLPGMAQEYYVGTSGNAVNGNIASTQRNIIENLYLHNIFLALDEEDIANYKQKLANSLQPASNLGGNALDVDIDTFSFPATTTENHIQRKTAYIKTETSAGRITPSPTVKQGILYDITRKSQLNKDSTLEILGNVTNDILDQGITKILKSISFLSTTSPSGRVFGMAASPASPGRDFDVILIR